MTDVKCTWIYWKDYEDNGLPDWMRIDLGLPKEEVVSIDDKGGSLSEKELKSQCIKALNEKYADSNMKVQDLDVVLS